MAEEVPQNSIFFSFGGPPYIAFADVSKVLGLFLSTYPPIIAVIGVFCML